MVKRIPRKNFDIWKVKKVPIYSKYLGRYRNFLETILSHVDDCELQDHSQELTSHEHLFRRQNVQDLAGNGWISSSFLRA